jgi:hypothetical protein
VYNITLAIVMGQIRQVENPMPSVVISLEAAPFHNGMLHEHLTSKVALEEPEIRSTDWNILRDNKCMDDELHFRIPGVNGVYEDEGDERDDPNKVDADGDLEGEALQADDGSKKNVEDGGYTSLDLSTSDVHGYKCVDTDDADPDEEDEAL